MYTFEDRDGTSLTLRPENTASVIRAYIEHRLDQRPGVQKLYYIGPMFRRERPQKGRYRQFFQIGAEAIGSESPFIDAEVIEMVVEILTRAGLSGFTLLINSVGDAKCRPVFVEKLREALRPVASQLVRRLPAPRRKPIRCACSIARFRKTSRSSTKLPSILDNLCEICGPHFAAVQRISTIAASPMKSSPRLVRGLDYYMRTTFEVVHGNLGAQNSVLGGGRYDGLAESLGSSVACARHRFFHRRRPPGDDGRSAAGRHCSTSSWPRSATPRCCHAGAWRANCGAPAYPSKWRPNAKLKRAMELANKLGARYALILGDDEIAAGEYSLKDMQSGEQRRVVARRAFQILKMMGTKKRSAHVQNSHMRRTPRGSTWERRSGSRAGCATAAITAAFTSSISPITTA